MFETQRAKKIKEMLLKISPEFSKDAHCVLRAYLTKIATKTNQLFVFNIPESEKKHWEELCDYLPLKGRLDELLNDFVPLEVLDVETLLNGFNDSLRTQEDILFNILLIKSLEVSLPISKKGKKDLWGEYKDKVKLINRNKNVLETSQKFYSFLSAMYSIDLDKSNASLGQIISKDVKEIVNILYEDFRCSREKSIEICASILDGKEVGDFDSSEDASWFFEENQYGPTSFSSRTLRDIQSDATLREKYNNLVEKVSNVKDPWNLFKALWIIKRKVYDLDIDGNRINAKGDFIENAIAIENSIVERIFKSQSFRYIDQERVLIVLPSPLFIESWFNPSTLKNIPASIVVENKQYEDFYERHFKNGNLGKKIKFIALEEFLRGSHEEIKYNSVLVFENHVCADKEPSRWEGVLDKIFSVEPTELYVLGNDNEIHKQWSLFHKLLVMESANVQDIVLFPEKLNTDTGNRKKYFLHASLNGSQQGIVNFYSGPARRKRKKPNIFQEDSLWIEPYKLYLDFGNSKKMSGISILKEGSQTLREFFNEKALPKSSGRTNVHTLHFSDEIVFQYTQTEVYCLKYLEYRFASKEERIIKGTKIRIPNELKGDSLALRAWVQNKYPFLKNQITNIRESVATFFKQNYIDCNLTFKTFWYIYSNIEETLAETHGTEVTAFLKDFATSAIGSKSIDTISLNDLENYLNSEDPLHLQLPKSEAFQVLLLMFNEAKELKCCNTNIFVQDEPEETKNLSQKNMQDITRALKTKTASYEQLRTIFNKINELIKEEEKSGFALLLRFMTGLDAKIICSLKWGDFIYNKDFNFYYFSIYKRISVNNREQKLDALSSFRLYPCSPYLAKRLLHLKDSVQKELGETDLKDRYILCGHDKENFPFDFTRLPTLWNKIAKLTKCTDFIVSVPNYQGGFIDKNLSDYNGDFLKENIKYWFLQFAGMVPDEVNYLLGYKCHSTFYANYCDFLNPASLYKLHRKLARFDSVLLYAKKASFEDVVLEMSTQRQFSLQSQEPLLLELSIEAPEDLQKVELKIASSFGTLVSAQRVLKGEENNEPEI